MADGRDRFSKGEIVYFVDDYHLSGSVSGDGQLHRAVVSSVHKDTIGVGVIDGRSTEDRRVYVNIDPERALTAEEIMETVFELGAKEVLAGIQQAIEQ